MLQGDEWTKCTKLLNNQSIHPIMSEQSIHTLSKEYSNYSNEQYSDCSDMKQDDGLFIMAAAAAQVEQQKKRQVSIACTNCKKAHVACDFERPCKRCSETNRECINVCHKPRGRPRLKQPKYGGLATTMEASQSFPVRYYHPIEYYYHKPYYPPVDIQAYKRYLEYHQRLQRIPIRPGESSTNKLDFKLRKTEEQYKKASEEQYKKVAEEQYQKSTEEQYKKSTEEQLKKQAEQATIYLSMNGIIVKASNEIKDLFGCDPISMLQSKFGELIHSEQQLKWFSSLVEYFNVCLEPSQISGIVDIQNKETSKLEKIKVQFNKQILYENQGCNTFIVCRCMRQV